MASLVSRALSDDASLAFIEPRHAVELAALIESNKAHLRQWLPWVPDVYTEKEARGFIQTSLARFAAQNGLVTGIWVREQLVGLIDLHAINWTDRSSSIGYWLGEDWQGRGLMTRACRALLDHAFNDLNLTRMEIRAATENHRSRAIPERLGFQLERVHPNAEWLYDHYVDHTVYVMLAQNWETTRKGRTSD
jgi:ribosomal-protein-serine acetyltransferase